MAPITGKTTPRQLPAKPRQNPRLSQPFSQIVPVAAGQRRCAFRLDSVRFKPVKDALLDKKVIKP
jgi:hypothetical protein